MTLLPLIPHEPPNTSRDRQGVGAFDSHIAPYASGITRRCPLRAAPVRKRSLPASVSTLEHFYIGLPHRAIGPLPHGRGSWRGSIAIKNKTALNSSRFGSERFRAFAQKNTTPHCGGFSLVEAIIATVLVGTLLVAVLHNVGAAKMSQYQSLERTGGYLMAQNLMAEILAQSYEEPNDTPTFGRESGESGGQRDRWDDVDDYTDWSANPPERQDGTAITGADWTRSVAIDRVNPDNFSITSGTDLGAKKITVTVVRNNRVIATLTAIRTSGR